jgi:hypothetical protein
MGQTPRKKIKSVDGIFRPIQIKKLPEKTSLQGSFVVVRKAKKIFLIILKFKNLLLLYFLQKLFLNFKKFRSNLQGIKKKALLKKSLAAFSILAVVSLAYFQNVKTSVGATYTFRQVDWNGGQSALTAIHPDDETGWNKYDTAPTSPDFSDDDVKISEENYETTDDGTLTTTGTATGGTFNRGTNNDTAVSGSGSSAKIQLAKNTTVSESLPPGVTAVYYSVGQNTYDHKTCIDDDCNANPLSVVISGGVATFSTAQTASNLGVGDRLTAGGNIYYLASKNSETVWNVITKIGAVPSDLTSTAVASIAHEYASLFAAEAGASDANHLGTSNLVAGNFVLNFPCYYDSGPDTSTVVVNGWTTGENNYIRMYAPNNIATEVNQSQRHNGKWDETAYQLSVSSVCSVDLFLIYEEYVRIDGLQFKRSCSGGRYPIY